MKKMFQNFYYENWYTVRPGGVDFLLSKASINFSISPGTGEERKNDELEQFITNLPDSYLLLK